MFNDVHQISWTTYEWMLVKMDATLTLYDFVHSGASIYTARIVKVNVTSSPSGQETISLQLRILDTLWGQGGKPMRRSEFTQPESETAQLKFPHPIWGQIDVREGALLLLVTYELTEAPEDPVYVDEIADFSDPVLTAISTVLQQERPEQDSEGRRKPRYLRYVSEGPTVQRLLWSSGVGRG